MHEMKEIEVKSSLDGSLEKSLLYWPDNTREVPLVVGLHSWSFGRDNQVDSMLPFCKKRGWALLLPEFRGPNTSKNPRARQACGSIYTRHDIVDAVEYVIDNYSVNPKEIFLIGGSGGGHMALMAGAYSPDI